MKIAWFTEDNVFGEDLTPLKEEIKSQGMDVIEDKYIPFQGGEYSELFKPYDLVIFYGSLNLARQLTQEKHKNLVIYSTVASYECTKYYAYLAKFLLNKDYVMMPFSELKRQREFLYHTFGSKGQIFVRPSSGEKTFTGTLVNENSFDKDYKLLGFYDVEPHAMVVISTPKEIKKEWRLVVSGSDIISGSLYHDSTMNCDYEGYPEEVGVLAKKVIAEYNPDPVWTVDICQTADGELHLLEIGGFSCAGMYSNDVKKIVSSVSSIANK
jgi:hypothetical protein